MYGITPSTVRTPRHRTLIAHIFCSMCLIVSIAGCAVPDVSAFTSSTIQLKSALSTTGASVVAELRGLENDANVSAGTRAAAGNEANKLEEAWQERIRLLNALAEYANSLQAIVDAGQSGRQSAQAIADSIDALAGAAGLVQPGAGIATHAVTQSAVFVYEQIAEARAAASLEKAVAAANPAIQRIAEIIGTKLESGQSDATPGDDLGDLRAILRATTQIRRNHLRATEYGPRIAYRNKLVAARDAQYASIKRKLDNNATTSVTTLPEADEIDAIESLITETESWHSAFEEKLAALNAREKTTLQLIDESRAAIEAWAAAHARILAVVRGDAVLDPKELADAVVRIRGLIDQLRELE